MLCLFQKRKMMETLELREIISKEWRTDDFIKSSCCVTN